MTEKEQRDLLLLKAGQLGKAQARYSMGGILFALLPFVLPEYAFLSPFGVSACILAWFGIGRAGAEIQPRLKELIEGYNYGLYGGAPPLIWAMFYSRHGKEGFNRFMALMSYPASFTLMMWGAFVTLPNPETLLGWVQIGVSVPPLLMVSRMWIGRIKSI